MWIMCDVNMCVPLRTRYQARMFVKIIFVSVRSFALFGKIFITDWGALGGGGAFPNSRAKCESKSSITTMMKTSVDMSIN